MGLARLGTDFRRACATARRLRRCIHCSAPTDGVRLACEPCSTPAGPWPSEREAAAEPDPGTWGALLRLESR